MSGVPCDEASDAAASYRRLLDSKIVNHIAQRSYGGLTGVSASNGCQLRNN